MELDGGQRAVLLQSRSVLLQRMRRLLAERRAIIQMLTLAMPSAATMLSAHDHSRSDSGFAMVRLLQGFLMDLRGS